MTGAGAPPVAVVTGGNRGIGLEVCRQLEELGFHVILGARDPERGVRAAEELARAGAEVEPRQLDIADDGSVAEFAQWLSDEHGRLHVLVNNAASHYDPDERAVTVDLGFAHDALETDLFGAWRTAQALVPLMRATGGSRRIVNVSSGSGSLTDMGGGTPAYGVAKAALNALTRKLAAELRDDGILVNAVCPGWVATEMGRWVGRPIPEGAASVVWAVTIPDDGPTGGFFRDGQRMDW